MKIKGIEFKDYRHIGLGIRITKHPDTNYCEVLYNSGGYFYISTKGTWLTPEGAKAYAKELLKLSNICEKLNQWLTDNPK